jgi:glutamyl/glutaminyl-tRNA synthetase
VPKYLNLYEALDIERPILATMPFVLAPDGKKKLSKRDGAKDVLSYAKQGFLPESMENFMATLGWNDGSEQELFTVDELIKKFSLDHVQRSGAKFDEQRLVWMNGAHIRQLPLDKLFELVKNYWPEAAESYDETYKRQVLSLVQERLKYFEELAELTEFFFKDLPVNIRLIEESKQLNSLPKEALKQLLVQSKDMLAQSDFSLEDLTKKLNQLLEATGQKPAVLFSLIRIATTEVSASPGLADTLAVLGQDRSLKRIDQLIEAL